ncbi:MAG: DNA gyrase subunit A [Clostridia bacterium]|nr:DNA gyrase subunit A [Clostridia bacterium]
MNYDEQKIIPVEIRAEMQKSYIDYAMSVIVGRALPDVRDGLKPVHRRILYTMYEAGLTYDKAYSKSVATVGDVLKKYHPHGDASVYDALVRLAQDFSLRYPLVDGRGNFGSVDGDPPAAYRYTEARMAKISDWLLMDIEKETVDFTPSFDDQRKEPVILPTRLPTLLLNGSMGIAVGMATNIPPHNLCEVADALLCVIDNPEATLDDIMQYLKGPDFPTGGIILGRSGIREAYYTGRGRITVRARTEIEEFKEGRYRIVVTEIPYGVNKSRLIESMADLVKQKRVEGISDLRDESDRKGMKIIIEIKRDANAQVVLNQLFKHSQLQDTFSVNMLALVDNQPKTLGIRQILDSFVRFREEVVENRTRFELKKARDRAHILEGLKIAIDFIDEVINIIRNSPDVATAKTGLMERFGLSDVQAQAIVDMRLGRLAGLEREKIEAELMEMRALIERCERILADEGLVLGIIRDELIEVRGKFGDERRTEISPVENEIDIADLIPEEDCAYLLTHYGYIKRMPVSAYKAQRRGGRGITGMTMREEDFVERIVTGSSHEFILFFTNKGRMFKKKGYEIPEAGRTAKGMNVVNLLEIESDEKITAMIILKDLDEGFMTMITKLGTIKKTALREFNKSRRGGLIALSLDEGDELICTEHTDGTAQLIAATAEGKAIRFMESDVRPMGRGARGVRAIRLEEGDVIIGASAVSDGCELLTVTENGFGKRTPVSEYRLQSRGGGGVINYRITEKTGRAVSCTAIRPGEEPDILLIASDGVIIRFSADTVSRMGRAASGVKLMRLASGVKVVNMACAQKETDSEQAPEAAETPEEE